MISVVIPTYQRPHLLMERCLPSVMRQTVKDWEVIVVGDGTDELTCRLMEGSMATDERITFVNLPHATYPPERMRAWEISGVEAFNHGWDLAKGEWLWRLDDDDELEPWAFDVLLSAQALTGADVVYGISRWWNEAGYMGWDQGELPPGPAKIADGANLRRTALPYRYDPQARAHSDLEADSDLWTRMVEDGVKFHFEPRAVHRYWHWREGFGGRP